MADVLIVGAGITGLTAAYELHRRGVRPLVLEASPRAGGLIHTERAGGFVIEAGADSVLGAKPAGLALIKELGLEPDVIGVRPPGGAFVLRGTRLYALPRPSLLGIPMTRRALARYDLLPWPARLRMALEPWVAKTGTVPVFREPGAHAADDESVASFFRRRFGAETVDLIAQPLLGGIHAGDIEHLSMRSLFPRLLDAERVHGSVLRAIRQRLDPPCTKADAIAGFASLKDGMGSLVRALEAALPPGTIRCGARAAQILRGFHIQVEGQPTEAAPAVIIAAPAHAAASLLEPIDAEVARLCGQVPYVSTATVALAWPRDAIAHPLSGSGFVVARRHSDVRITACTWVSSKWDHRAPDGSALLRAFIGGAHDPGAASLPDDELVAIVRADLARAIGIPREPALARVHRWPNAGAQHTVGHLARVAEIERRLTSWPGLFVAGSGFRSVGIPDCVADARRVALEAAEFLNRRSGVQE